MAPTLRSTTSPSPAGTPTRTPKRERSTASSPSVGAGSPTPRKQYICSKCHQPKKGHECPVKDAGRGKTPGANITNALDTMRIDSPNAPSDEDVRRAVLRARRAHSPSKLHSPVKKGNLQPASSIASITSSILQDIINDDDARTPSPGETPGAPHAKRVQWEDRLERASRKLSQSTTPPAKPIVRKHIMPGSLSPLSPGSSFNSATSDDSAATSEDFVYPKKEEDMEVTLGTPTSRSLPENEYGRHGWTLEHRAKFIDDLCGLGGRVGAVMKDVPTPEVLLVAAALQQNGYHTRTRIIKDSEDEDDSADDAIAPTSFIVYGRVGAEVEQLWIRLLIVEGWSKEYAEKLCGVPGLSTVGPMAGRMTPSGSKHRIVSGGNQDSPGRNTVKDGLVFISGATAGAVGMFIGLSS